MCPTKPRIMAPLRTFWRPGYGTLYRQPSLAGLDRAGAEPAMSALKVLSKTTFNGHEIGSVFLVSSFRIILALSFD